MSAPTVEAPVWIAPEDLPLYQTDVPEHAPFADTPIFAALAKTYAPDFDAHSFLSAAAEEVHAHEKADRHVITGTLEDVVPHDSIAPIPQPRPTIEHNRGGTTLVTLPFERILPFLTHTSAAAESGRSEDETTIILPRFRGSIKLPAQRSGKYSGRFLIAARPGQADAYDSHRGDLLQTA